MYEATLLYSSSIVPRHCLIKSLTYELHIRLKHSGSTPFITFLYIWAGLEHSLYGASFVNISSMHIPNT